MVGYSISVGHGEGTDGRAVWLVVEGGGTTLELT
jgi:hypothetical protein